MAEKIIYITNKELLAEIHKSKNSYSYFVDEKYNKYDIIAKDFSEITEELKNTVLNKIRSKGSEKTLDDLVYRIMTDEHVPLAEDGKLRKKGTGTTGAIRTTFPPFKQYIIVNGEYVEIGRSHWKGNLETGVFCDVHGKISNRLARLYKLLIERYALRGNWRGYCVDETTEALTQRGWLNHNELTTEDIILAYDMNDKKLKWSKIKSIFKDENYNGKMFHLTVKGMDALVTPGHKFITQDGGKEVENLLEDDDIILMGDAVEVLNNFRISDFNDKEFTNLSENFDMKLLLSLSEIQRTKICMELTKNLSEIDESQFTKTEFDNLLALCVMAGLKINYTNSKIEVENIKKVKVSDINFNSNDRTKPTVEYKGVVWCPETEYGTFMARRNGTVFLTHNSYNDEMICNALLQLSQVALQFDESKSDNPFAFYTQVIKHCFTRVLNIEKKNQDIRDDLLIMYGSTPSNTRQVENEMEQREEHEPKTKKSKNGK